MVNVAISAAPPKSGPFITPSFRPPTSIPNIRFHYPRINSRPATLEMFPLSYGALHGWKDLDLQVRSFCFILLAKKSPHPSSSNSDRALHTSTGKRLGCLR